MISLFIEVKDSMLVDTTDIGYRIGFTITSWLPFLIIVIVFVLLIRKRYRFPDK